MKVKKTVTFTLLYTVGGVGNWYNSMEGNLSIKLQMGIPFHLAILLLGICPPDMLILVLRCIVQGKLYWAKHIVNTKYWKQLKCPLIEAHQISFCPYSGLQCRHKEILMYWYGRFSQTCIVKQKSKVYNSWYSLLTAVCVCVCVLRSYSGISTE